VIKSFSGEYFYIRKTNYFDDKNLCEICLRTGNAGGDASHIYSNRSILGQRWVLPYVALENDLAFVLVEASTSRVVGYALACLDTVSFENRLEKEYLPLMQQRYPFPTGERATWSRDQEVEAEFHKFHFCPASISDRFPSHLHIDIIPEFQRNGLGRPFLRYLLRALRSKTSAGVHLEHWAPNVIASKFYRELGFREVALVKDGHLISSSEWKFDPKSTLNDCKRVERDASTIVYLGMNLLQGERHTSRIENDNLVAPASPTVWEPARLLRFENLETYVKTSAATHPSEYNCVVVCTAPEPWLIVEKAFSTTNTLPSTRTIVFMPTTMSAASLAEKVAELRAAGRAAAPSIVYGVGGGSACDAAKYVSYFLDIPLVLVPSILSVDAPFTRAAGIRELCAGRTVVKYVGDAQLHLYSIVIDIALLQQAPNVLNRSGVGDVISIVPALWDWREAHLRMGERYDPVISQHSMR
jgi:ribosomal protein S18 acetylase RimI-like enzyme